LGGEGYNQWFRKVSGFTEFRGHLKKTADFEIDFCEIYPSKIVEAASSLKHET
jgi:hypothetical protein